MSRLTNIYRSKFIKGPQFKLTIYNNVPKDDRYNEVDTNRYFEIDSIEDITIDLAVTDEVLIHALAYFV